MISRRKVLLGLGTLLAPTSALAAATTQPPASSKPPVKPDKAVPKKKAAKTPPKKKPAPEPRLIITVNKVSQKMTVTLDGDDVYKWPISTGGVGYDTPSGTFRPFRMEKEHFSKEWDDAPMPYSIFFTGAGHALHGSYHIKSLGRRASHGCVRIHPDNAAKLFALVQKTGMSNTRIVIKGGFFEEPDTVSDKPKKKNGFFSWAN